MGENRFYVFTLYVSGMKAHSLKAIENLKKLCEEHLPGNYELKVVDLSANPGSAENNQIIAAPTLIKELPLPVQRFIGDLSHIKELIVRLEIE